MKFIFFCEVRLNVNLSLFCNSGPLNELHKRKYFNSNRNFLSIFNEQAHIKRVVCLKLTTGQCSFFFNLLCVGHLFPMWYYIFNIYCLQTNCKSKYAYWLFCACIFLPFLAGTYWVISASSIAFPISSGICVK